MKAHLLYRDRDIDMGVPAASNAETLTADLELETLFSAMARGDKFILETVRKVIFDILPDSGSIIYRQEVLRDCLGNPSMIREMYAIADNALARRREYYWGLSSYYIGSILSGSVNLLEMFAGMLLKLRVLAEKNIAGFRSDGGRSLLGMLIADLSDDYLEEVREHLRELHFPYGHLISASLGTVNQGTGFTLRRQKGVRWRAVKWAFAPSFSIHPRDDNGSNDITHREDTAVAAMADALSASAGHVLGFLRCSSVSWRFT